MPGTLRRKNQDVLKGRFCVSSRDVEHSLRMTFEKSIGRDWCLVNAELHQESFTKALKRQLGWGFTEVIYEGKDNVVWVYYPPEEYLDGMRSFILSQLEKDKDWLDMQASIILRKIKATILKLQQWKEAAFEAFTSKDLCRMFEEFIEDHEEIWPATPNTRQPTSVLLSRKTVVSA